MFSNCIEGRVKITREILLLRQRVEFETSDLREKEELWWHRCESQRRSCHTAAILLHLASKLIQLRLRVEVKCLAACFSACSEPKTNMWWYHVANVALVLSECDKTDPKYLGYFYWNRKNRMILVLDWRLIWAPLKAPLRKMTAWCSCLKTYGPLHPGDIIMKQPSSYISLCNDFTTVVSYYHAGFLLFSALLFWLCSLIFPSSSYQDLLTLLSWRTALAHFLRLSYGIWYSC